MKMLIIIKHRGGFAGLDEAIANVDTAKLKPEAAKKVESTVSQMNLKDFAGSVPGDRIGADFLAYEVTLEQGGSRNSFRVLDDGGEAARKIREFAEELRPYSTAA
jgi:Emfourin